MRPKQLRQLRRRQADEPYPNTAGPHLVGPRRLVLVIHERAEDDGDIRFDHFPARPHHVVAVLREDPGEIGEVHAWNVVHPLLEHTDHPRHAGKRQQPRAIAAHDCVFRDHAVSGGQIHQQDTHEYPPARNQTPDHATTGAVDVIRSVSGWRAAERDRSEWYVGRRQEA